MNQGFRNEMLHRLFGLDGKTAVVIGGGGVLAGQFSEGLANAGAHVVVVDVNDEHGKARVNHILQAGDRSAEFFHASVTDRSELEALVQYLAGQHRHCDVLVNSAGVNTKKPFLETDPDADWRRIFGINLDGVFNACQVFGRYMVEQQCEGSIINVASVTATIPLSGVTAYSASKHGVLSLTRSLAMEWASKGIRVNAISPGFFVAEQNRNLLTPDRREAIIRQTPMARFGAPEELVGTILLLAGPAGRFITGANFAVDGGVTAFIL